MASSHSISYDQRNMLAERVGAAGIAPATLRTTDAKMKRVAHILRTAHADRSLGFMTIPERKGEIAQVMRMAKDVRRQFRTLVVVGIGGSDLGARALLHALKKDGKGMDVRFIGANTDPDEIAALLADIDLKTTAINIISKSGDTIEPMSTFLVLRDRLVKTVGKERHARHVIATTDREKGTLRGIADREGYRTLPVPDDIGGRFSALTPVGLFPAACAGISVKKLIEGATGTLRHALIAPVRTNGPMRFAGLHHDGYMKREKYLTVLMPYSSELKEFGAWFRQLWAESLGKKMSRKGKVVHHGLTPIAALGATDQHSQLQLYNEGPNDKMFTFIEVREFSHDMTVPNPYPKDEGTAYMKGIRFSEIIHAERLATAHALAENGRPNGTLTIPKVDAHSVGALMMFFMVATAAMGELLDIDAYDQPGVEDGKKAMYSLLGRKGYRVQGLRRRK